MLGSFRERHAAGTGAPLPGRAGVPSGRRLLGHGFARLACALLAAILVWLGTPPAPARGQTLHEPKSTQETPLASPAPVAGEGLGLSPPQWEWLGRHKRIRLGVDPDWPPFEFWSSSGRYSGIASDYARLMEKMLGVEMAPAKDLSWSQALEEVQAGRLDVFPCMAKTAKRSEFLDFTRPYLSFPMVVVTRDDHGSIGGMRDLAGQTVAVGRNYASHEILAGRHPEINLLLVDSAIDGLRMVSEGKADALVDNLALVTYLTKKGGLTNLKVATATPYNFELSFAVRKDWPELTKMLDLALDSIDQTQKNQIHDAWISMRFEHEVNWAHIRGVALWVGAVVVLLLALVVAWNARLAKEVRKRKAVEEALRDSESRLRTMFDTAPDALLLLDTDRRILDCNPAFLEAFAYKREQVVGQSALVMHQREELFSRFGVEVYPQVRDKGSWRGDWCYRRADGALFQAETVLSVLRDADGEVRGYFAVMRDISERRKAEEELRNSTRRSAEIIDFLPDPTLVIDNQGRVEAWNKSMEVLTGIPAEEILGKGDYEYALPFYGERRPVLVDLVRNWDESLSKKYISIRRIGENLVSESFHPHMGEDGIFLSGVARVLYDSAGRPAGAIESLRNVTERKRTELELRRVRQELEKRVEERTAELSRVVEALRNEVEERRQVEAIVRESEAKYRAVLEGSPNPIVAYDKVGRVMYVNPAFTRLFAWEETEVLGRRLDFVPEDKREEAARAWDQIKDSPGGTLSLESQRLTKSGQRLPVEIHTTIYRDSRGEMQGGVVSLVDITERKRTEEELQVYREDLETLVEARTRELGVALERARAADRLKSAFLANMSHELRTPLNSIIGFTGIILQGLVGPLNDEQAKQMGMVQHSARHLLSLINDVLDLSKIEAGQLQVEIKEFDLPALLSEVVQTVRPMVGNKGLLLTLEIDPKVKQVASDRRRVEQILLNLVNNAVKFTDRGRVKVTCALDNGSIVTRVEDTGIGISPEGQERLFLPFRQLDSGVTRRYEGTGLGLSICRRLLELLGGGIRVESRGEGQGSAFIFTLPA
jgi:PAS domain S-box-containing protein